MTISIITGIRRCGKSTFFNQLLEKQKKGLYLNFEDPRLNNFEFADFLKVEKIMQDIHKNKGIYFFDEIQNIPKWENFVRYLVDKKQKVVITGSNADILSRDLGTKLTGRHLPHELFPFSFSEFILMKRRKSNIASFKEYFKIGGFPEFIKKEIPSILHELLSDVVMKDIAIKLGIKNTELLNKIAIYLISNVGKEFLYNSLKKIFNIKSVQTVIDYISYFENAYIIFVISKFDYSYKKQLVNPKKVYSIDNGLSNFNSISFSSDRGKMLENLVFINLRRRFKEIFYFKKEHECDFVIKDKEKLIKAVQVCYNINDENMKRELDGLKEAMTEFKLKKGTIITYDQEDDFSHDGFEIKLIPAWKWL